MANPLVSFTWEQDHIETHMAKLPARFVEAVARVVRSTTIRLFGIIKFSTPVATGRALAAWKLTYTTAREGASGEVSNDVPYINVLEFGGYPVRASPPAGPVPGSFRRGRALLGGFPPGPRTQASGGGDPPVSSNVSKQAPHGMVRAAVGSVEAQFAQDLEREIERVWTGKA